VQFAFALDQALCSVQQLMRLLLVMLPRIGKRRFYRFLFGGLLAMPNNPPISKKKQCSIFDMLKLLE
jgi:hypothetical protein